MTQAEIQQLQIENQTMKADIKLMAVAVKDALYQLGMITPEGEFSFSTRSIGKLLPKVMSGEIGTQLNGLSHILPLFDKYKHLAD